MHRYRGLILALLVFSGAIAFSTFKILREYEVVSERFIPNLWVAAQAEIEYLRFSNQLALSMRSEAAGGDVLEKRLYVLASRLPLLLQGSESRHVRAVPGAVDMISDLREVLDAIEPDVVAMRPGDAIRFERIRARLAPFEVPLHRLVSQTMQMDETIAAGQRADVRRVYWEVLLCFAGITASASALVLLLFQALRNVSGLLRLAHSAQSVASQAQSQLKAVIDAVPARVTARDREGRLVFRNRYDAALAAEIERGAGDDGEAALDEFDRQVFETAVALPLFERMTTGVSNAQLVWLTTKVPLFGSTGEVLNVVTVALDISEQKEAQARNALLATALEHAGDAIEITDSAGRFIYVNPAFKRISGYDAGEAIGQTPFSLLMSDRGDEPSYRLIQQAISSGQVWHGVLGGRRKDGAIYQQEATISPVRDFDGTVTHHVAVKRDITERLETQRQIWHLAHHDTLTDLPNRMLFMRRLNEAFAQSQESGRSFAVLFVDVDKFKDVNDTLGHHAGDALLKMLTLRLLSSVREGDTVARLGGDEFAIIHPHLRDADGAIRLGQRVLEQLAAPFRHEDQEFQLSASIGITIYPEDSNSTEELLKNADLAMYRAKAAGRSNYQRYEPGMNVAFQRRKALERDLKRTLGNQRFELYYQPQIDLAEGKIVGAEALLRWFHPDLGAISPTEFIPLAEECGLITPLGEWVLETACRQAKTWQDRGLPPIRMAVNLSAAQFLRRDLVSSILQVVERSGLAPQWLELEITESLLMRDSGITVEVLRSLNERGIGIALDDFGTGFSSMSYLKQFPVTKIKIDRAFVAEITTDPGDAAIVRAVSTLGHDLGIRIAAEGVETAEQLEQLSILGCDELQGFYLGVPVAASEFERRLRGGTFSGARLVGEAGTRLPSGAQFCLQEMPALWLPMLRSRAANRDHALEKL